MQLTSYLFCSTQISCSLPSVLHISFGPYLSSLLQYFSYLSVASLQMLPWPCYASSALFSGTGGKYYSYTFVQIIFGNSLSVYFAKGTTVESSTP